MNQVPISLLKPHPKNNDYYDDLPDDKYQEIKRSIEAHGIRDPLKVTPDYTVIAGHQRLRIARELGLEKVPVVILDVTPEEAEYLLIADNEERRQSDGDNPMKKARRAEFLKRYWNVRRMRQHLSSRKLGQGVRLQILSKLKKGSRVVIDFGGVQLATHSFCDEAFAKLLQDGISWSDFKQNIRFLNANDSIKTVVQFALRERVTDLTRKETSATREPEMCAL